VQNKFVSLVVGFILTMIVVIVLVVFLGRASIQPATDVNDETQPIDTAQMKGKTDGLVNYGDLPKIVTKDDIERSNPFESY